MQKIGLEAVFDTGEFNAGINAYERAMDAAVQQAGQVVSSLSDVESAVTDVGNTLGSEIGSGVDDASSALDDLASAATSTGDDLGAGLADGAATAQAALSDVGDAAGEAGDTLDSTIADAVGAAAGEFDDLADTVDASMYQMADTVGEAAQSATADFEGMADAIANAGDSVAASVQEATGMSADEIRSLQDAAKQYTDQLGQGTKDTAQDVSGATQEIAADFMSMSNIASEGVKVLSGNLTGLGGLIKSTTGIRSLKLSPAALGIGAVLGGVATEIGVSINNLQSYSEAMRKAAAVTGTSVSFLSQFTEAADDMFISQEQVTAGLRILSQNLGRAGQDAYDAKGQLKGLAKTMQDYGVALLDASGNTRKIEELIPELADTFKRLGEGTEASSLAMQLFGRQGAYLVPLLVKGKEGLEEMMLAAKKMGLSIDENVVKQVTAAKQAQDAFGDSITALQRTMATSFLPTLTNVTNGLGIYLNKMRDVANKSIYDWSRFGETFSTVFQLYTGQLQNTDTALADNAAAEEKLADAKQKATGQTKFEQQAMIALGGVMDTATGRVQMLRTEFDLMPPSVQAMIDRVDEATAAGLRLKAMTQQVTFQEYDAALEAANEANIALAKSMEDANKKAAEQALQFGAVASGVGQLPEKLDKAAKAQAAFNLATGKTTVAQGEQQLASELLYKRYDSGKMTLEQYTEAAHNLADGNISIGAALLQAGVMMDPASVKLINDYRAVEAAGGKLGDSQLDMVEGFKVLTQSYMTQGTATMTQEEALTAYNLAQKQTSDQIADITEKNNAGIISDAAAAQQKAKLQIEQKGLKQSYDDMVKAIEAGQPKWVSYDTVTTSTATNVGALGTKLQPIPDEMDLAAEKADALARAMGGVSTAVAGLTSNQVVTQNEGLGTGALLDPLQRAVQAQSGNIGKVGGDAAQGVAEGITKSTAISTAFTDSLINALAKSQEYLGVKEGTSEKTSADVGMPAALGVAAGVTAGQQNLTTAFQTIVQGSISATSPLVATWATPLGAQVVDDFIKGAQTRAQTALGVTPPPGGPPVGFPPHDYYGPAKQGQPYSIGMPEIFVPKTSGTIIPLGDFGRSGNVSTTGDTLVKVYIGEQQLVPMITKVVRSTLPNRWGGKH